MSLTETARIIEELIAPKFKHINEGFQGDNATIAQAFVYPKVHYSRQGTEESITLHVIMKKAGSFEIDEPNFHKKMEEAIGAKLKWHMSNFGETGGLSDVPEGAVKVFDAGFKAILTQQT